MTADESVVVKGSPVRSLQKFVETDLTAEQRERVFADLPAGYAARLRRPILATETVPVHMLNQLTEIAARAKGEALEEFARRAGREGANDAVHGIYRFFVRALTPSALLSKGSTIWSSLYNRGRLEIESENANSAVIRLADFPSERPGCLRLTGWIERMAELTSVKDVRITQTECFAKGDPACVWNLRWS